MDEQRFIALWKRAGSRCDEAKARQVFAEMAAHYDEPHRHYHTAEHIRHCLRQLDLIPDDDPHRDAVELAIWFHDVIYRIGDPANEANSARWFREQATGDLPDALVDQVCRLIVATEHRQAPTEPDTAYVIDIDLSSFGQPYEAFIADSALVRAESTHLDDEAYFRGQREFLEKLLRRDRIFVSDLFHRPFEERARDNIRRTLQQIEQARHRA